MYNSQCGGDEKHPKAVAVGLHAEGQGLGIMWANVAAMQILTHWFEYVGSIAAASRDDGGGASILPSKHSSSFQGISNPRLWRCLKDTSIASKHIVHPCCSVQHIDETVLSDQSSEIMLLNIKKLPEMESLCTGHSRKDSSHCLKH